MDKLVVHRVKKIIQGQYKSDSGFTIQHLNQSKQPSSNP